MKLWASVFPCVVEAGGRHPSKREKESRVDVCLWTLVNFQDSFVVVVVVVFLAPAAAAVS